VRTDADGFRADHRAAAGEAPADIIFLGDSFTYGVNGAWDDTFVGMYASYTRQVVINAGVSLYSPTPYLYQYRKALAAGRLKRSHSVVVGLDYSDILDERMRWKDGDPHPVAYCRSQWRQPVTSPLLRLLADNLLFAKSIYLRLRQPDQTGPPVSVFDPVSAFSWGERPAKTPDLDCAPLDANGAIEKTEGALERIGALAGSRGGALFVLMYPWPAQLEHEHLATEWERFASHACRRAGCAGLIDTFPRFRGLAAVNPRWYDRYYVAGDVHLSSAGNRVIFEEIVGRLATRSREGAMGRLDGKVAIVTGGTSGIGKRTVERFAEEGAAVVVGARREAEGQALARALGPRVDFVRTDVAREADLQALVDFAVRKHGRLDVLFNNAGGPGPVGGIETIPLDAAERAMAVNFGSVLAAMKHAAPVMMRQRAGSIINNASVAGTRAGYSSSIIYSAAKAAVIHLTRLAALQLAEHAVRVNAISPGGIATGIFAKALGLPTADAEKTAPVVEKAFATLQPIPRAGLPDDIASAAVFLASDESSFVTGQDLVVDGGLIGGRPWSAQQQGLAGLRQAFGISAGT
jgi:NAD(P)-dependent dehydrogenase (short-subunit alcohol dehydrogenase family)